MDSCVPRAIYRWTPALQYLVLGEGNGFNKKGRPQRGQRTTKNAIRFARLAILKLTIETFPGTV